MKDFLKRKKFCICCSRDDKHMIEELTEILSRRGIVILAPQFIKERPDESEKQLFMEAHFEKINISDYVMAIFDSKIGANTLIEIGYALAKSKTIIVLSSRDDLPDELTTHSDIHVKSIVDIRAWMKS